MASNVPNSITAARAHRGEEIEVEEESRSLAALGMTSSGDDQFWLRWRFWLRWDDQFWLRWGFWLRWDDQFWLRSGFWLRWG